MTIINCGICWNFATESRPNLALHVHDIPDSHEIPHDVRELAGQFWYYGERDGIVHFCIHDPKVETGYDSKIVPVLMKDKTIRLIKGPWPSDSVAMHHHGKFPWSLRAAILVGCSVHGKWYLGHITKELGKLVLKDLREKEEYADVDFGIDPNEGLIIKIKGVKDDQVKKVMRKRFDLDEDFVDNNVNPQPYLMKEEEV